MRRVIRLVLVAAAFWGVVGAIGGPAPASANPVLAGEWPDPTVIKVGGEYVASATSNDWAPAFRLLRSRDLVHWRLVGAIFRRPPAWAVGSFWAPELARLGPGRYAAYYSARSRGGGFCIGVATASRVLGPYRDRGPRLCPPRGAIDPFPVRDEHGVLHLLWKQRGERAGVPTAIVARRLTPDGLTPVGGTHTLIKADKPWESGVVEGPAVMRHRGTFFLYWAGAGCCDRRCRYGEGVARSASLLGPWEERRTNPVLRGSGFWRCPGHGTPVRVRGGDLRFLYHAFRRGGSFPAGRQMLLDQIRFGRDGWPRIGKGTPSASAPPSDRGARSFLDDFRGRRLSGSWEWPANGKPRISVGGGRLRLGSLRRGASPPDAAILARRTTGGAHTASALFRASDVRGGGTGGIGVTTRPGTSLVVAASDRRVVLLRRAGGRLTELASVRRPRSRTFLRVVAHGERYAFATSGDGRRWRRVGATQASIFSAGSKGVRVALFAGGPRGKRAGFRRVRVSAR